jgi:hypothetical protein
VIEVEHSKAAAASNSMAQLCRVAVACKSPGFLPDSRAKIDSST